VEFSGKCIYYAGLFSNNRARRLIDKMDTPSIQTCVPWPHARAELRTLGRRKADVFDDFYNSMQPQDQERLQVAIVQYPYGDKIVDAGRPYWPGETEVPQNFIASAYLPFGFILENCCEVSDFIFSSECMEQIPQALLPPRETIGLFEVVDCFTGVPHPQKPEWHITAGATSIYTLPNLHTRQNKQLVERQLGEPVEFSARDSLINQLRPLQVFQEIKQKWKVRVLYFSRGWFELLIDHRATPAATAVMGLLTERSWKALARVRKQKSNRLREHLNEATHGGVNQTNLAHSAVLLLTCIEEILADRRACFAPAWEDDELGPFGTISTEIISAAAAEPAAWILRPTYLSFNVAKGVGYMRLDHASAIIMSGRSTKGAMEKVRDIMSILRVATQGVKKKHNGSQAHSDLQSYVDLLPHVAFQTPTTKWSGGPNYYKFEKDSPGRPQPLAQADFYAPHFADFPRERCPFFRNSLRVSNKD
jgi:hypothetical protein